MDIVGNIVLRQVTRDTAKQLSERFGRINQEEESVSINIRTRKIATLTAEGVNAASVTAMQQALADACTASDLIAPAQGLILAEDDTALTATQSLLTAASVLYDAVYVPGGTNSVAALEAQPDAIHF